MAKSKGNHEQLMTAYFMLALYYLEMRACKFHNSWITPYIHTHYNMHYYLHTYISIFRMHLCVCTFVACQQSTSTY